MNDVENCSLDGLITFHLFTCGLLTELPALAIRNIEFCIEEIEAQFHVVFRHVTEDAEKSIMVLNKFYFHRTQKI